MRKFHNHRAPWSADEEAELQQLVSADLPKAQIAFRLGRTQTAIANKTQELSRKLRMPMR
jgi:hypothetical protein